jgi:acyl dehydratase
VERARFRRPVVPGDRLTFKAKVLRRRGPILQAHLEISQQVAQEQGYDIVLRTKDVVMYQRAPAISDLTPEVEKRLQNLFPSR